MKARVELDITKKQLDSSRIEYIKTLDKAFMSIDSSSRTIALLSQKMEALEKKTESVIRDTEFKVDTFRLQLPDSMQSRFDSIIAGYDQALKLKDTEISFYKQKELAHESIEVMQSRIIRSQKEMVDRLEAAYAQAHKAARPGIFKRIINKLPDLSFVALILIIG